MGCRKEKRTVVVKMFCFIGAVVFLSVMNVFAADPPKRTLNNSVKEIYNELPKEADTFAGMFENGMLYGRLRMNYFYFEYEHHLNNYPTGFGLGGSFIYKTGAFHGVSATAGLYTSQNLGLLDRYDALNGRAGKDTFSRYDRLQDGDWNMTVLAQAYLQYDLYKSQFKLGRQTFESFLTASNDTKMIPHTFEGCSFVGNDISSTTVTLGYFWREKNRDHTTFHDVITYDDGSGRTYSKYNNQDDSAAHKGLSYQNLKAAHEEVDNDLVVAGVTNKSIDRLKLDMWFTTVPDLFSSLMGEANYRLPLPGGYNLTPGLRFMQQFDLGAGHIGGAALSGGLAGKDGWVGGYDDADSVDGRLYAARLVLDKGAGKLLAGYSKVADDADLIAPWRGFPTGGYTRAMAQYNWFANTESVMIQWFYDFGKAGIVNGFRLLADFTYTDFDDDKARLGAYVPTDVRYYHMDLWYMFPFLPELEAKLRLSYGDADDLTNAGAITKAGARNASYGEVRCELNYLF